jgi:hypothetical protein
MAEHTCGCNENTDQNAGSKIIKHILCVKSNQSLVIWIAERLLPKLFWLSVIASIVLAFKAASQVAVFTSNAFYIILSFVGFLIVFLLVVIISFYTIYLLKALKDAVVYRDSDKDNRATLNSSVFSGEVPVRIKKKPGPKKGSKRGRKPKVVPVVSE